MGDLYDHYKETFRYLRDYIKTRDRYTLFILIVIFFNLCQICDPDQSLSILTNVISSRLGVDLQYNISLVKSAILFLLLSLSIRYFQIVIQIERQYKYVHSVEEKLSKNGLEISRESKMYLDQYPTFLCFAHQIYTIVFPAILIVVIIIRFLMELKEYIIIGDIIFFFIDIVLIILIFIATILYLLWIHFRDFRKEKYT